MPRREALLETASRLDADPDTARGRRSDLDAQVQAALERRDAAMLDDLAMSYDQEVPDPDAAARLRALVAERHLIGYLGKLIPQKGVESLLAAAHRSRLQPSTLIVGFGLYREWLTALTMALKADDVPALTWLRTAGRMPLGASEVERPNGRAGARVRFTGRLDHRCAPGALAAMDILVVPSILPEAFGMVAAEGAAAGALPLVARHSGLSEVAESLEDAVGRPRLFSFEPGPGASGRIAEAIDRLLALPGEEREELCEELSRFVAREWSWERAAERLLRVAQR
jgi:glycosyltransferase involved in cell wall biosynthesis